MKTSIPAGNPIIAGVSNDSNASMNVNKKTESMAGNINGIVIFLKILKIDEPAILAVSSNDGSIVWNAAEITKYERGTSDIPITQIIPGKEYMLNNGSVKPVMFLHQVFASPEFGENK